MRTSCSPQDVRHGAGGLKPLGGESRIRPPPFAQPRVGMVRASALVPGTHFG